MAPRPPRHPRRASKHCPLSGLAGQLVILSDGLGQYRSLDIFHVGGGEGGGISQQQQRRPSNASWRTPGNTARAAGSASSSAPEVEQPFHWESPARGAEETARSDFPRRARQPHQANPLATFPDTYSPRRQPHKHATLPRHWRRDRSDATRAEWLISPVLRLSGAAASAKG
ncbi:hypothetical protein HPB48_016226 [Haemaphysalis longicornis]|uniref:Uncharacterized protein n=1 Tax=Haemaphysalis longicornis TaxID=44386 RepID=A0A9J6G6I9_HAELO|nr:hypothetical protein HPB48_016226 [Haemaphysalis longicornis]